MKDRLSEIRERLEREQHTSCMEHQIARAKLEDHAPADIAYLLAALDRRDKMLEVAEATIKRIEDRTRIMVWEDACPATINSIAREALSHLRAYKNEKP